MKENIDENWYLANNPGLPTLDQFEDFYNESLENCSSQFIINMQRLLQGGERRGWYVVDPPSPTLVLLTFTDIFLRHFMYWLKNASGQRVWNPFSRTRRVIMERVEGYPGPALAYDSKYP